MTFPHTSTEYRWSFRSSGTCLCWRKNCRIAQSYNFYRGFPRYSQAGGRCVHTCPQNFGGKISFCKFLRAEAKFSKSVNFPINLKLWSISQKKSEGKPTSQKKKQSFWKSSHFEKMDPLILPKTMHYRWKIMILEVLSRYTCSGWPQMHSDVIPWPYILGKVLS